jgi:hypothetical protein
VELKKSKSPVSLRTGKKNQLSETSRGKSSSPIGKGQKNSHNLIEKRYRNNLNSKINALRDSIPSLCSTAKEEEGEDAMDSDSGEMRKAPKCNKVNKSIIISSVMPLLTRKPEHNPRQSDPIYCGAGKGSPEVVEGEFETGNDC